MRCAPGSCCSGSARACCSPRRRAPRSPHPSCSCALQRADFTHQPASDWIALAAVPRLEYIGGFQIGYRLQPTGVNGNFQTAALSITEVPDGQPTQPTNTPPYCVGKNGTEGTITPVGSEIQFEGDGTYSFSVSLGGPGRHRLRGRAGDHRRLVHRRRPRGAAAGRRPVRVPREAAPRRPVRRHPRGRPARRLRRQQVRDRGHGPP